VVNEAIRRRHVDISCGLVLSLLAIAGFRCGPTTPGGPGDATQGLSGAPSPDVQRTQGDLPAPVWFKERKTEQDRGGQTDVLVFHMLASGGVDARQWTADRFGARGGSATVVMAYGQQNPLAQQNIRAGSRLGRIEIRWFLPGTRVGLGPEYDFTQVFTNCQIFSVEATDPGALPTGSIELDYKEISFNYDRMSTGTDSTGDVPGGYSWDPNHSVGA